MNQALIDTLCKMRGIESNYVDAWGNNANVVPESKVTLLRSLGYSVDDEAKLAQEVQSEQQAQFLSPLPPVLVVRKNSHYQVEINLPAEKATEALKWCVEQEQGERCQGHLTPVEGHVTAGEVINGVQYQRYQVSFSAELELGYHTLKLATAGNDELAQCRFVVAPNACYKQPDIASGKKIWGPTVQLYCLRTRRNWGVGDFTDLQFLIKRVSEAGGDYVGLNPIHALYPADPESASPYSPSSRNWLNIIYIDVEAIPEFALSERAQQSVAKSSFQNWLRQLRDVEHVDYRAVTDTKLDVLREVYATFCEQELAHNSKRAKAFNAFVNAGGDGLKQQAAYDALQAKFIKADKQCWGWPAWPEEYQQYATEATQTYISTSEKEVGFYLYLQWIADEQLEAANQLAVSLGMEIGIYRDLAVGVSEGSTEIWADENTYVHDASVGAPPDILGPQGQNWGLPPMDPVQLQRKEYQPIIDLFRSNMAHCGALRIDHVMALLRLWWVPRGQGAETGAYVSYPVHDLLGLLALESHRNQCLIIGEDLGTVPDGIFEILQENGVHSYRVFFFERSKEDGGFFAPQHYPEQSMAVLTTHDLPTLKGFWHCLDLSLGKELGVYPDQDVLNNLYQDRHESKQRVLDSLHGMGSIGDSISRDANWVPMSQELNFKMQLHLAKGSSALLGLQLEDWLEMEKPVNVPGTSTEYPNWRRKLSADLETIFAEPAIQQLMAEVTAARKEASAS